MFNFSYMYGGTEYSFAQDAGLPIHIAKNFVADYNRNMPHALAWKKSQLVRMREIGWVENVFHRRRHYKLITPTNLDDARKACVHAVIAGTASDLTLKSLIAVQRDHHIPIVMTVHDSIIAEVDGNIMDTPESNPEMFRQAKVLQDVMVGMGNRYQPSVPWKVDVEIRKFWSGGPVWELGKEAWKFHDEKEAFETSW
jgi:DNA polymerase I-like protein with 3'-5' exonuclease and polymerase domains